MDKRFTNQRFTKSESWCTGKDSNLRTSLGGTDLQSVGFNHSPTCAKTFGRCGYCAPSGRLRFTPADRCRRTCRQNAAQITSISQNRETRVAHKDNCEDHCTPEKMRMECVGKTCCAANRVRHLPENSSLRPKNSFVLWSWRRDSNPRPSDYKSDALPTELRQQIPGKLRRRAN
jgi:hypothetical protein